MLCSVFPLPRSIHTVFLLAPVPCSWFQPLAPVGAQEAPQQISPGFSCGPDIKGARGEKGNSRGTETQDSKHWHQHGRGERRTWNKAEQVMWRMKGHRKQGRGGN